jgi:hypothetical protein
MNEIIISFGTMRTRERLTVERYRNQRPDGEWTITSTGEGWVAKVGGEVLFSVYGNKPRTFKTLDAAVRRLQEEIGVTRFEVEAKAA